jgi:hypothetical protein
MREKPEKGEARGWDLGLRSGPSHVEISATKFRMPIFATPMRIMDESLEGTASHERARLSS